MAREYGKNWFSMWTDEHFCTGRLFDKLFYQVLLGQSGTNDAGICPINFRKWRKALRDGEVMPTELDLKASLVRQERRRYVFTDEDTGEVLIRAHIRRDQVYRQPAVMVAALRDLAACQSPKFARVMLGELDRVALPTINTSSKQGERLRDSLKQTNEAARLRLETLAEGLPEPFPEPFAEDFPEGLPEPFPRPAETEPFPRPSPEGSQEPPVVVEVEVVNSSTADTHLGGAHTPEPDGATRAVPDPTEAPPEYCPQHMPSGTLEKCGPCKQARISYQNWYTAQTEARRREIEAQAAALVAERRAAAQTVRDEIRNCTLCDDDGYRPNNGPVCDHQDRTETHRNGMAKVRAALGQPANLDETGS